MLSKAMSVFRPETDTVPSADNSDSVSRRTASGTRPKSHLEDYLAFYLTLTKPGYAVLVTGAWGTGKTFQVRNCVPEDKRCYISLFGVQTVEQLHAEVFAAAYPNIGRAAKVLSKAGNAVKDVGGVYALAGAVPSVVNALIRRELRAESTLVFDDLERSELNLKDILGAIHFYIEQRGFRAIVITHDEKLQKKFLRLKEKTFGQTIRVEPQIETAFESFVDSIGRAAGQEFIQSHRGTILETFTQSGECSLRVLRHIIEDLDRLHRALSSLHLQHVEAMRHLVVLFTAFDIETRAGRLSAADLRNRRGSQDVDELVGRLSAADLRNRRGSQDVDELWEQEKHETTQTLPLTNAGRRYPGVDLENDLLSDDLLVAMFVNGRYDETEIRRSLDNSAYFIEPEEEPPWKVVINFDKLEDEVTEAALRRMETQFAERSVNGSGEMLHIFALRLMMANYGITEQSLTEETAACKAYVDDLLAADRLPPRETDLHWREAFEQSHDGYGYWLTDATKSHFIEIRKHLVASRENAFRNAIPQVITDLLAKMTTDANAVFEMISPTNNGDNPYAHIPLLHEIQPEEFVEAWLSAPRSQWRLISYALQGRYENERLELYVLEESNWALAVHQILVERAASAKGFSALRIRRVIPMVLHELAARAESTKEGTLTVIQSP